MNVPRLGVAAAAIVLALLVGMVSGYFVGGAKKEASIQKRLNAALQNQAEQLKKAHKKHISAISTLHQGVNEANEIDNITRPGGVLCDAGPEWLHAVQNGVRAANNTGGTDATPPPAE